MTTIHLEAAESNYTSTPAEIKPPPLNSTPNPSSPPPKASSQNVMSEKDSSKAPQSAGNSAEMPPPPKARKGKKYRYIDGKDAFYRFSDICFEWHKGLSPFQANATKSLLAFDALCHPDHPLREKLGNEEGLVLYIGICHDGKARLLISFRQIEYLTYYISHLDLIPSNPKTVQTLNREKKLAEGLPLEEDETEENDLWLRWRKEWARHAGLDGGQGEGEGKVDERIIPLPSSKSFLMRGDMKDVVPVVLNDPRAIKSAGNKAYKIYEEIKARQNEGGQIANGVKSIEPAPVAQGEDAGGMTEEEKKVEDEKWAMDGFVKGEVEMIDGQEVVEIGPSQRRPSGPISTYQQAEQAYLIASQGGLPPAYAPGKSPKEIKPAGKGAFLAIDFESWEMSLGVVLECGWAACWFEEGEDGEMKERRDQDHWIVQDNLDKTNGDIITDKRNNYVFGKSETVSLSDLYARVNRLIETVRSHSEPDAGPIYLITHSADKELELYGLLDLPFETFHKELQPEGFVAPAYSSKKGDGKVFVFDTSELAKALYDTKDGTEPAKDDLRLQSITERLMRKSGEDFSDFGNSGNDAYYNLELFLTMVQWTYDSTKAYFDHESDDEKSNASGDEGGNAEEERAFYEQCWRQANGIAEDEDVSFNMREMEYDIGGGGPEDDIEW